MRLEYKFLVPNEKLDAVRQAIAPYVRIDDFAAQRAGLQYTVRSIYFDTAGLQDFIDKVEGVRVRKKIRIRGYNARRETKDVFFEIKRKFGAHSEKMRTAVPHEALHDVLESAGPQDILASAPAAAVECIGRFLFHVRRHSLNPKVLVIYEREAYNCTFNSGLRLTIDKNLRSRLYPALDDLFEEAQVQFVLSGCCILEVKFNCGLPRWLLAVIRAQELRQLPLSKYTICLTSHRVAHKRHRLAQLPKAMPIRLPDTTFYQEPERR